MITHPSRVPRVPVVSLWLFALSCASPASASIDVTAQEALEQVRAAVNWRAMAAGPAGWRVSGTCTDQGLEGTFEKLFTPDGRFLEGVTTPMGGVLGFDGETLWMRDHSGMPRVLALASRDDALGASWVASAVWLDPERQRFRVTMDAARSDARTLALDLTLGSSQASLLVDRETWLPRALEFSRPGGVRRVDLSDWRAPQGFQVAHRIEVIGVAGETSTYRVAEVGPMPTFVRDPFTCISARPADTTFLPQAAAEIEVRGAHSGHLLVHPLLDGRDVGWFLLDSGAGMNCIDPAAADTLGWERFGEVAVVGAGGASLGGYRRGGRLALGPAVVEDLPWLELDLAALEPIFGTAVSGVIGYDLFARAVVVVDLQQQQVWLHDPTTWEPPAEATPLALDDTAPCVDCTFAGGHHGWFRLDTGSDDTVTFHGPAVQELGLLRGREDLLDVSIAGVGGVVQGRRGRLRWFELGSHRIERPKVTFMLPAQGALDSPQLVGNIGGGLLHGFRVAFDLSRRQVTFLERR